MAHFHYLPVVLIAMTIGVLPGEFTVYYCFNLTLDIKVISPSMLTQIDHYHNIKQMIVHEQSVGTIKQV